MLPAQNTSASAQLGSEKQERHSQKKKTLPELGEAPGEQLKGRGGERFVTGLAAELVNQRA